jgi:hypothetical protein
MMRHKQDLQSTSPPAGDHFAQVAQQANFVGNLLHARPELAAVAQKIVVWVDQEDRSGCGIVTHDNLLTEKKPPDDVIAIADLETGLSAGWRALRPRRCSERRCAGKKRDADRGSCRRSRSAFLRVPL